MLSTTSHSSDLGLDSILPHREVLVTLLFPLRLQRKLVLGEATADGTGLLGAEVEGEPLLLLPESLERGLVLGQTATNGTGLLGAEVEGNVLLVLVEQTELLTSLLGDNGVDTGNGFADTVDLGELGRGTTGDLLNVKASELLLKLVELLLELSLVLYAKLVGTDGGHFFVWFPGGMTEWRGDGKRRERLYCYS